MEIDRLFTEYFKAGDSSIREKLIIANMPQIDDTVKEYAKIYNFDIADLMQQGYEILMNTIDNYSPNDKCNFHTILSLNLSRKLEEYIMYQIYGADAFNNKIEYYEIKRTLEEETGKNIEDNPEIIDNIAEMMADINFSDDKDFYKDMVFKLESFANIENIDNHNLYYMDDYLEKYVMDNEIKNRIIEAMNYLTPIQRDLIKMYYGFDGYNQIPISEIANEYKTNEIFVKRIINDGIKTLRETIDINNYSINKLK